MTKAIFISVRTGSTRLPQKALLEINGKPCIFYLIEGLKKSQATDNIILCTTRLKEDDVLCEIAAGSGIRYYRGSSEDKLQRWNGACKEYGIEFFVNADGDDLFFASGLADLCFKQYDTSRPDFIDGHGLYNDIYGIKAAALYKVCETKVDTVTEFIRPHFVESSDSFVVEKLQNIPDKYKKKNIRLTLDYEEDFKFFNTIITSFYECGQELQFEKVLSFLEANPDVVKINWHREAEWRENQQAQIEQVIVK